MKRPRERVAIAVRNDGSASALLHRRLRESGHDDLAAVIEGTSTARAIALLRGIIKVPGDVELRAIETFIAGDA